MQSRVVMLSSYWKCNATVNNGGDPTFCIPLDESKPDFLEELLPFHSTVQWQNAGDELKQKVLTYAWVLYNHKTVYVESDLIVPVCDSIIKGEYAMDNMAEIQEITAQAMVDEAVHTQMSINASNRMLQFRNMPQPEYMSFYLTTRRNELLSMASSDSERRLISLGIACASETLVTDYLDKIATATSVQPLCQIITAAHASDEQTHSGVFTLLLEAVITGLTDSERSIVRRSVHEAIYMFSNKELGVWHSVLQQLDFPDHEDMLIACEVEPDLSVYIEGVSHLLSRVSDSQAELLV